MMIPAGACACLRELVLQNSTHIVKSAKIAISHTEISEKVAHTIFFQKVRKKTFRENPHMIST